MSEPYDLLEQHRLEDVLKGVEVEVLVARAMGAIIRGYELEEMARRNVQKAREKLPQIGPKGL